MKNLDKLKEIYPDLVEEYSAMTKEELLEQICAEVIDLHNMEERVATFMEYCTLNMSKTNYTVESIKSLINEKQENDIGNFCGDLFEDFDSDEEIIQELKNKRDYLKD